MWNHERAKLHFRFASALLILTGAFFACRPIALDADPVISPTAAASIATQMNKAINSVRGEMKLPPLTLDTRLCAAADGHVAYLTRNHVVSHEEQANLPGFTATTAAERANAQGYAGECYESVIQGTPSALAAVRRLFNAPYHRAPFLQPGTFEVGSATQSDIITLMFGVTPEAAVETYPYDGAKNVPTAWDGEESPNPLRLHPEARAGVTGYAITLFRFSPEVLHLNVTEAKLTIAGDEGKDGKSVPFYLNTPDNDNFLVNGALLLPQQPLQPGTTYRVTIRATDSEGVDCSRVWTFTTAPTLSPFALPRYVASRSHK